MNRNDIYITKGSDYLKMTKELLAECHLASQIKDRNNLIGIKPNLVSPSEASWGATTHPEIVSGIIEYLQEHNFHNMVILEGSWVGDRTSDSFDVCGYRDVCEKYKVPFWDMQKDKGKKVSCEDTEIWICERALSVDFLINVPVLKGHCQTQITCALKNMKGLLPNAEKRHFHSMGLHKPIALLNKILHQDFIIVDNICGDLDFEDGGHPVQMDRIWAGCDPVMIDSLGCKILGLVPEDVEYLSAAAELGVGKLYSENTSIHYLRDSHFTDEVHKERKIVAIQDMVHEVDSCSACYGSLIPALSRLQEEGILPTDMPEICIGQGYRNKTGYLGIGQCTRAFEHTLKGCPPDENEIYQFLKSFIAAR